MVYNIPKFFELYTDRVTLSEMDGSANGTADSNSTSSNETMIVLKPTDLRLNRIYIRVYILWMNLLLQIIGPFVLLIVLNVLTYKRIKDFEQTLNDTLRIR